VRTFTTKFGTRHPMPEQIGTAEGPAQNCIHASSSIMPQIHRCPKRQRSICRSTSSVLHTPDLPAPGDVIEDQRKTITGLALSHSPPNSLVKIVSPLGGPSETLQPLRTPWWKPMYLRRRCRKLEKAARGLRQRSPTLRLSPRRPLALPGLRVPPYREDLGFVGQPVIREASQSRWCPSESFTLVHRIAELAISYDHVN
jgi:hypothetical protein